MAGPFSLAAVRAGVTSSPSATKETFATCTPISSLGYPPQARILRTAEYRQVYDQGFRVPGPLFVAFCLERSGRDPSSGPRLGLTVPRAIGKANIRNRIKRRLREAFRLHRHELQPRWDIVLNPRKSVYDAEFPEIEKALGKLIHRCNSHS